MQNLNSAQLNRAFDASLWPRFDGVLASAQGLELALFVGPELDYFAGHFPQQPVLPGIVQIHWAGELAKRVFACQGFAQLKGVKFNQVIMPNSSISLTLDYQSERQRLKFSYFNDNHRFSSGALTFGAVA